MINAIFSILQKAIQIQEENLDFENIHWKKKTYYIDNIILSNFNSNFEEDL